MKEKKSLKTIPLSMRGKKRYLSIKIVSEQSLTRKEFEQAFLENYLSMYGSYGLGKARIQVKDYDSRKGLGIVRCALEEADKAKASILFIEAIAGKQVLPLIEKVSGSIVKAGAPKKPKPSKKPLKR